MTSEESVLFATGRDGDYGYSLTPTIAGVTEGGSGEGSGARGDDDDIISVTLLTSAVPYTLATPVDVRRMVEVASGTPRHLDVFIPERTTLSALGVTLEDLEKVEQEGLGETPDVIYTTTPRFSETTTAQEGSGEDGHESEEDQDEEFEQPTSVPVLAEYPGVPQPNATFATPLNLTDSENENITGLPEDMNTTDIADTLDSSEALEAVTTTDAPHTDVEVTLLPGVTPSSGWETPISSTAPQESRSDLEYHSTTEGGEDLDMSAETHSTTTSISTTTATSPVITTTTEQPDDVQSPTTTLAPVDLDLLDDFSTTAAISEEQEEVVVEEEEEVMPTEPAIHRPLPSDRAVIVRTGNLSGNVRATPCKATALSAILCLHLVQMY